MRGRLDGGGEGGIPDLLPLGQVWRQPRGPGYLQRTSGPEQQVRRLLLQAQRYYGGTVSVFTQRKLDPADRSVEILPAFWFHNSLNLLSKLQFVSKALLVG